jgi:hypothetical protein
MTAAKTGTSRHAGQGAVTAGTSAGMPLGARRLLLIGGLCVPVGLVAGPYVLGAQLLAVAGVIMVAVALSYRRDGRWFSRWSWLVTATGVFWLAATAAYWGSIIVAADASTPSPAFAPALFNAGLACFGIMALAALAAMMLRMIDARHQRRKPA